jgi:hypothetical protein
MDPGTGSREGGQLGWCTKRFPHLAGPREMDIEELLGCFPTQLWSTVRELKKEKDEKVSRIHDLEKKWSTLDT